MEEAGALRHKSSLRGTDTEIGLGYMSYYEVVLTTCFGRGVLLGLVTGRATIVELKDRHESGQSSLTFIVPAVM